MEYTSDKEASEITEQQKNETAGDKKTAKKTRAGYASYKYTLSTGGGFDIGRKN
ncbi:MAG: hypothetical protein LUD77_00795 [Clostridiales bacterium]|nr:hypothetical protein [Clostridiales bacterium]